MAIHPEAQMLLDGLAALELPPFETIDVEMQRTMFDNPPDDGPEPPPIHESIDRTVPGPAGDIPVRIFKPTDAEKLPVIVYFHGGGWVISGLNSHDATCRAIANAAGAQVVSVDYRRAPDDRYPAAFDDSLAVTRWVADHAAELGVDGSRLAIAGDSAGGNLAAAVAIAARDGGGPSISAQLLIYPVTNLMSPESDSYTRNGEGLLLTKNWMNWFIEQYVPNPTNRSEVSASPIAADSLAGLPPAMVITAEYDPLLDQGTAYAARMKADGVDVVHDNYEGQIHGFATSIGIISDADVAIGKMAEFLAKRW